MKRFICILLSVLMLSAALSLTGCKKKDLRFGMGVYANVSEVTSAEADKDGQGKIDVTVAVLTVDKKGKVVACQLDMAENTVKYSAQGKAISNDGFKTKYEQGNDYNMAAYGGAAKEWFEQADAFEGVVVGKTLDEIKAMVADGGKGTDEVINAGCTIAIGDFVSAIERAFEGLSESDATSEDTLELGINTEQTVTDATADKDGSNEVATTIFAAAVDADGKVIVAESDCVQVAFTFDSKGNTTFDATKPVVTKRQAGADYGMVAYGGAAKEWFGQADAFDALCVGKTADEIVALCGADGYGTEEVKSAGCTITVNGFTKAAAKIG